MIQYMTGSTGPALKKDIVNKLLREEYDLKVIICSSVLSMGVDMTGIEFVIMEKVPPTVEQILQIAGRCGRSETSKAVCITLNKCNRHSTKLVQECVQNTTVCRRQFMSRCFGGQAMLPHENHLNLGCCDVCNPRVLDDEVVQHLITPTKKDKTQPLFKKEDALRVVRRKTNDQSDFREAIEQIRDDIQMKEFAYFPLGVTALSYVYNINQLVKNLEHIGSVDDVLKIVPSLEIELARRIMLTVSEIYPDEKLAIEPLSTVPCPAVDQQG